MVLSLAVADSVKVLLKCAPATGIDVAVLLPTAIVTPVTVGASGATWNVRVWIASAAPVLSFAYQASVWLPDAEIVSGDEYVESWLDW